MPPKLKLLAPLSIAAILLLAGCANSDSDSEEVLPIEPILSSEINIVSDETGTRAEVDVTTNIPVACAIVYGTDGEFGNLAVDQDMDGGAHEDHGPVLTGLEPDTVYEYTLQGSDQDGNLYKSEVMSFRTPVATAAPSPGSNIATESSISGASSSFSDSFDAALAIDGDLGTEWSSAGDGDDAWIELSFDASREVIGFGLRSRSMNDGTSIIETFTVTVDGGEVLGPFPGGTTFTPAEANVSGQTFRFDAETTSGGNTGAVEVEIYAAE